jgi:phospholipid-binding lipoprotein MlaA
MAGVVQRNRPCRWAAVWVAVCALVYALSPCLLAQDEAVAGLDDDSTMASVRDPFEPANRGLYAVNDKLYFWVLKPVATGYAKVVPEKVRDGVGRVFANLGMPRRGVNCLLQGKTKGAATEVGRFVVNSTAGVLGFWDIAESRCGLETCDEDFGQTLGRYGVGYGCFLTLPLFGPSNPRDTVGLVADSFLDPLNYVIHSLPARLGVKAGDQINGTSRRLGEYERSKETALDHYIWLRESYTQYRAEQIRR